MPQPPELWQLDYDAEHSGPGRADGWLLVQQNALMGPRLDRGGLRGAVYLADVPVLVDVLDHDIWPADALQLLGEAVLVAAGEQAGRVRSPGRRCAARLRARVWEGDSELADQIASALGLGPGPVLRPLAVDLEELAGVLEGDHRLNGGGRIDVRTGEVWALAAVEYAEGVGVLDSDEVDDQRWLEVVCEGSRAAYRDWRRSSTAWMTFGLRIGWGGRFRAGERFVGQGRAGRLA